MTTATIDNTAKQLTILDKTRIDRIGTAIEGLEALASLNVLDDTFRVYSEAVCNYLTGARGALKHGEIALYYEMVDKAVRLLGSIEAHRPQEVA